MSKIIVIAGDSWGCGEWNDGSISHPGLTQYLLDSGYQVFNLSQPGGTNKYSAERVASFLEVNAHYQISKVIVFQTEWSRDIFAEDNPVVFEDLKHGYYDLKSRMMTRFYHTLSTASLKINVPIYIVGGCGDTIWLDKFATEYPGVKIACQSVTNLLLNNDHRTPDPIHAILTDEQPIDYIKKHFNTADLELLLEDIDTGYQRLTTWNTNKEYFWPDGAHLNQFGHKSLFEFLKIQIPDL
jgi:hypothetical protein